MVHVRAKWAAALAVGLAVGFSAVAMAQPGPFGGGRHGRLPFAELQLSEQQRSEIHTLFEQQHQSLSAVMKQFRDLQRQLNTEIFADTPDVTKIEALKTEIAKAEAEMLAARVDVQMKVAQILTAEQRQEMRNKTVDGRVDRR